jgi:hypothetical protein
MVIAERTLVQVRQVLLSVTELAPTGVVPVPGVHWVGAAPALPPLALPDAPPVGNEPPAPALGAPPIPSVPAAAGAPPPLPAPPPPLLEPAAGPGAEPAAPELLGELPAVFAEPLLPPELLALHAACSNDR